ncbi:hypothetical protein BU23DRAFT_634698 [Bimuria novae-zelandiae CBS 107.79]|uniref:Uncharacterized protein n=1 Tax=Bimuria novae-zelandiae CBS 107.79 TaxID=1447943 RepID=A0A6A5UFQ2_9PLEO|nr:hypothetical protein BU23DRAFT_634698 [Bimuria novae-zelandiae CBS 107.79]
MTGWLCGSSRSLINSSSPQCLQRGARPLRGNIPGNHPTRNRRQEEKNGDEQEQTAPAPLAKRRAIQWVVPEHKTKGTEETFAPLLFGQALGELKNRKRTKFDRPHLPSTVHTAESEKRFSKQKAQRFDKFRITQELRDFHNRVWGENDNYIRDVETEDGSLIGLPTEGPQVLEGDRETISTDQLALYDTMMPRKKSRWVSIRVIRRTAPDSSLPELFLVIPPNTTIFVNNKAIKNGEIEDSSDDHNIYVGPLGEFAIVELPHAPVFLWRRKNDALANTRTVGIKASAKPREVRPDETEVIVTFTPDEVDDGNGSGRDESDSGGNGSKCSGGRPNSAGASSSLPWILPIRLFRATVLVVLQYAETAEDHRITVHVLDPLYWKSKREIRDDVWDVVTGWDVLQRWMPGLGLDLLELREALPKNAQWVDTAAAVDEEEAFSMTVLNAWAIAMGLTLNPDFMPFEQDSSSPTGASHSRTAFFREAQRIFQLALSGRDLNWEAVYQFLRSETYIVDTHVPRQDHRIDLNASSQEHLRREQLKTEQRFRDQLKSQQSAEDRREQSKAHRKATLKRASSMKIEFPEAQRSHNDPFFSDEQHGDFINNAKESIRKRQWRRDLPHEDLRKIYEGGARHAPGKTNGGGETMPPKDPFKAFSVEVNPLIKAYADR